MISKKTATISGIHVQLILVIFTTKIRFPIFPSHIESLPSNKTLPNFFSSLSFCLRVSVSLRLCFSLCAFCPPCVSVCLSLPCLFPFPSLCVWSPKINYGCFQEHGRGVIIGAWATYQEYNIKPAPHATVTCQYAPWERESSSAPFPMQEETVTVSAWPVSWAGKHSCSEFLSTILSFYLVVLVFFQTLSSVIDPEPWKVL